MLMRATTPAEAAVVAKARTRAAIAHKRITQAPQLAGATIERARRNTQPRNEIRINGERSLCRERIAKWTAAPGDRARRPKTTSRGEGCSDPRRSPRRCLRGRRLLERGSGGSG